MITPNNLNYLGLQHQILEPLRQIHCLLVICIVWYLERFPLSKLDLYHTDAFVAFELRL